jgi:hypothetical protein
MKVRHKFKNCENCNFQFEEANEFCPSCGQENHTHKLPFRYFLLEYLGSIYNFDTKVLRTLKGMFVNPGETIALFNQNKRARFVPPVRMFLFSSFLFFLILGFGENGDDSTKPSNNKPDTIKQDSIQMGSGIDSTKLLKTKSDTVKRGSNHSFVVLNGVKFQLRPPMDSIVFVTMNKIRENYKKFSSRDIEKVFIDKLNSTMILLLPVFSFFLLLLYWRKRLYYSEFFVFFLFFQSQVLFIFSFYFILYLITDGFLINLVLLTLPVYFTLSLKRVYQQSWIKTLIKAFLFGCIALITLFIGLLGTWFYSLYSI